MSDDQIIAWLGEQIEEVKSHKSNFCGSDPNSYMAGQCDGEIDAYKSVINYIEGRE